LKLHFDSVAKAARRDRIQLVPESAIGNRWQAIASLDNATADAVFVFIPIYRAIASAWRLCRDAALLPLPCSDPARSNLPTSARCRLADGREFGMTRIINGGLLSSLAVMIKELGKTLTSLKPAVVRAAFHLRPAGILAKLA